MDKLHIQNNRDRTIKGSASLITICDIMKTLPIVVFMLILFSAMVGGCVSNQQNAGYAIIRDVDLFIPDGQPPSGLTEIQVISYIDAKYQEMENTELQISAKNAGTDVMVEEIVVDIGDLEPDKTHKETATMILENGKEYDIWVTVWQDGRMQVQGSVSVYLPDRTNPEKKLGGSLIAMNTIDVMTTDIRKDPIDLDIILGIANNGDVASGELEMKVNVYNLQTGITAVRKSGLIGTVAGNTNVEKSIRISVPNEYNYNIEVQLYEDDVLFTTGEGRITLAPSPQYILGDGRVVPVLSEDISTAPIPMATSTPAPVPYNGNDAQVGQFHIVSGGYPSPTASPGFTALACSFGLLAAVCLIAYKRGRS